MKNKILSKKIFNLLLPLISILIFSSISLACTLESGMINQDPYPALPGGYVEVLFQISGVGGDCENGVVADLDFDYPFSLDSGTSFRQLKASTYPGYGYSSNWNLVYKLRIDPNALGDDYEVELRYAEGNELYDGVNLFKRFNITIEDGRTDFEVHVQNYNVAAKNIVFEILNTGNQNIEALTVEIPKQENIIIKGSNRNIVGDLDASEYTTADFEATPSEGDITLNLYYTDSTGERRTIEKTVHYDPSYFVDSVENTAPSRTSTYIVTGVILILIILFFFRRHRKKKNRKKDKFEI